MPRTSVAVTAVFIGSIQDVATDDLKIVDRAKVKKDTSKVCKGIKKIVNNFFFLLF